LAGVVGGGVALGGAASLPLGEGGRPAQLLAVDPATFAGVAAWRADYADAPLTRLMGEMSAYASTDASGTLWALVDTAFLDRTHANVGDTIQLTPTDSPATTLRVVVGAAVRAFPTLDTTADSGFLVVDLTGYQAALQASNPGVAPAPNEVWLATSGDAGALAALHQALSDPTLSVGGVLDRRALLRSGQHAPLTTGLRGMLLLGVAVALGLALLGTFVASAFGARQRLVQFATLRALGASGRQVRQLLLAEEGAVYALGLLAGTLLGVMASAATLPLLAYADLAAGTAGAPPYTLALGAGPVALFYLAVLAAAAGSLLASAAYLLRLRPARALRMSED
jgi:hypothetical protein